MNFDQPTIVFTAATKVESHLVVELLKANGIEALAVEDQSGVSLWAFGTISQFHKPNVWIDSTDVEAATKLVREFERKKRERAEPENSLETIVASCEDCGDYTMFDGTLNGTTQECSHCNAYMDVGEFEWDEDAGSADPS